MVFETLGIEPRALDFMSSTTRLHPQLSEKILKPVPRNRRGERMLELH